jgi:indolepyruvate ferredoxin oxidoreductase beta subunit
MHRARQTEEEVGDTGKLVKKHDVVIAGVGGQGVVSLGVVLASAARREGLEVQLSEVHGMAQRGGSVEVTLRLSDRPINGALVAQGGADLLLATEPLEAVRRLPAVKREGVVVSSTEPVANIPDYPDLEQLLATLRSLPRVLLLETGDIASRAGSRKAANVVLAGAASVFLELRSETVEELIRENFGAKGEKVLAANLTAFRRGREEARRCMPASIA